MAYRIRRAPEGRRDLQSFYALASGRVHWTTFREVAKPFDTEEIAAHICKRLINANGKLANKISVEPC